MKKITKNKKYITLKDGGADFREMARIMTEAGYKMNHATARNQLILAVKSLITHISSSLKVSVSSSQVEEMISNPEVHESLSDILFLAYEKQQQEEK